MRRCQHYVNEPGITPYTCLNPWPCELHTPRFRPPHYQLRNSTPTDPCILVGSDGLIHAGTRADAERLVADNTSLLHFYALCHWFHFNADSPQSMYDHCQNLLFPE